MGVQPNSREQSSSHSHSRQSSAPVLGTRGGAVAEPLAKLASGERVLCFDMSRQTHCGLEELCQSLGQSAAESFELEDNTSCIR